MKRLAFALMTGVGYLLYREWEQWKNEQSSKSRLKKAEKQVYDSFKGLLDYGYEVTESRIGLQYYLRFSKSKAPALFVNLRPGPKLKCLIIHLDEKRLIDAGDFLTERGYTLVNRKDYDTFDDFVTIFSENIKTVLLSDQN